MCVFGSRRNPRESVLLAGSVRLTTYLSLLRKVEPFSYEAMQNAVSGFMLTWPFYWILSYEQHNFLARNITTQGNFVIGVSPVSKKPLSMGFVFILLYQATQRGVDIIVERSSER